MVRVFAVQGQDVRSTRLFRQQNKSGARLGFFGQKSWHLLRMVQYRPVIFQEYIEARYDLRITVVGDRIFPAAIYSQETAYKIDFRMDIANARIEAVRLPPSVRPTTHVMARLGSCRSDDMRFDPWMNGMFFIEINPGGQWLFY